MFIAALASGLKWDFRPEQKQFSIVGRWRSTSGSSGPGQVDLSGERRAVIALAGSQVPGEILMSLQMVLLPVFVQVGLTFFLLLWMVTARTKAVQARETSIKDIAAGQPKYPPRAAQVGNCFSNQFEVPVLFYFLIALALPLRHADLFIVLMSWVFVVTRFAHAGIFVTSNNIQQRSLAWFAGVLVLLAMWIYFALKMLLLI
jgi:hypothetical protein